MESEILAQPGKFRARVSGAKLQAVYPANEKSRNPGARPFGRLRLPGLRPHHCWNSRTQSAYALGVARGPGATRPETAGGRMRKAALDRTTKETSIKLRLTIEGRGRYKISTGIRFFDHM